MAIVFENQRVSTVAHDRNTGTPSSVNTRKRQCLVTRVTLHRGDWSRVAISVWGLTVRWGRSAPAVSPGHDDPAFAPEAAHRAEIVELRVAASACRLAVRGAPLEDHPATHDRVADLRLEQRGRVAVPDLDQVRIEHRHVGEHPRTALHRLQGLDRQPIASEAGGDSERAGGAAV